ncbi:SirA family protein [Bacillus cereus]|jgi:tRNA 2-thiouridine synthesizing protein A|uniref:Putative sulfur-carrier protein n=2 Tax=Bacillus mycoides TaxID=1405 RepID=A0A653MCA1_BACMY|nr:MULTISPECIES: sulfurtransferase TusA family protein [Bacillus cereus group]PEE16366.1 SirA family protein [Bacillus cereus]EJP93683.1 molybdopterin biosynthesis protein MoeB [Bacillus cereus VD142]MEC5238807.1 sulfurtransferase TusA family protein [Bacillus mycoides]MEC5265446.1 sulfurtransferase TusA family protein [Bacillus mycoides]MED0901658.1 sulfurtransferase TusA family protein [Bacillus nitratireducens]
MMNVKQVLDAKGLACPMPIVRTKKAMEALQSGEVLEVHLTDKGAIKDIPAWSQTSGHEVLKHTEEDGELKFWIKKA